jgi:hypothetical protein
MNINYINTILISVALIEIDPSIQCRLIFDVFTIILTGVKCFNLA